MNLYYYIAGILKLKSYLFKQSRKVKKEIQVFLNCVRTYSKLKFQKLLKSEYFKVILRHTVAAELENTKLNRLIELAESKDK